MTLTLTVVGGPAGGTGSGELTVDRRSAQIGRGAGCDWMLSDPTRHISSRHFEIRYVDGAYLLVDTSTNGTFLARTGARITAPHRIADGDSFTVGPFTIAARVASESPAAPGDVQNSKTSGWQGWDAAPATPPGAAAGWPATGSQPNHSSASGAGGWDAPPSSGASGGWDPPLQAGTDGGADWKPQTGPALARTEPHHAASGWGASPAKNAAPTGPADWAPPAATPAPVASAWDTAEPMPDPASDWSSAAPDRPPALTPDDLWGRIAEGNVVDWARGGFGQPVESRRDPLGLSSPAPPAQPKGLDATTSAVPPHPSAIPGSSGGNFLKGLNLDPTALPDPAAAETRAGHLFRKLIAGLVVMLESRARAKAQLGAEATAFSPGGHNPLKFARTPEEAMTMLLGPPQSGFLAPDRAVEDAFEDLQSHQIATLRAMQGALRTTLERFSPTAIRARATKHGVLERIMPAARDAALWQAYEREFSGVAQGSDEAFLDMFAKEFRDAYNEQLRGRGRL